MNRDYSQIIEKVEEEMREDNFHFFAQPYVCVSLQNQTNKIGNKKKTTHYVKKSKSVNKYVWKKHHGRLILLLKNTYGSTEC